MPDMPTVAAAIADIARDLSHAGIERARVEAEIIVRAAAGLPREHMILHPETPLSAEQAALIESLVSRRAAREPLPYVLGETGFYSLSFHVSPSAIVPRPETEILAEAAVERARQTHATTAADIGTGCGCLAVVLARELPDARLLAVDISLDALLLARRNIQLHRVDDRVLPLCSDLLSAVRLPLDFVVANLPYIPTPDFDHLQPEVRDFEPRLALNGGDDGLGIIRRLCVQLTTHLSDGGFAALEVGAGQASAAAKLLEQAGLRDIEILFDYSGIERVVIAWRRG
jgi:release factor glutamine methyltransferase